MKKGDTAISVVFGAGGVDINWDSKKDRDGIWEFFKKCKIAYALACKKHHDQHHNIMEAQLATQKKIIQEHIGVVK